MRHILVSLLLAVMAVTVLGCDTNGYASFGDPLDVIVPCGENTTAWVRSTCGPDAQGNFDETLITELITLGATTLDPAVPAEGCYNFTRFNYDGSSQLRVGSFSTVGDSMDVAYGDLYQFTLETHLSVLQRRGSDRVPLTPPEQHDYTFAVSPDGRTLTLTDKADGQSRDYQSLTGIISDLDLENSETDRLSFSSIAAIPMYQAFTRLVGYGAGGMTQYMNSPATFLAASQGQMGVVVTGGLTAPLTNLDFQDFEEFAGFVLHGDFDTLVSVAGNGQSCGELNFTIPNDPADPTSVYTGYHGYTDVDVEDGYAGDGCYELYVDLPGGGTVQQWVPSEVYNTIDLSEILPTDGRMPGDSAPACADHISANGLPWPSTVCPRPGMEACTISGH